jgi:hypothetical protein
MRVLARGIKLSNVAAVQCPQHADARHHGRTAELDDQEQGFYRGPPFLEILFGLGQFHDVGGGIFESDELATAHQPRSWVILFF